jgi:phospholipid/cholesterol/gamma-HCH transport system substrate-binding protein
MKRRPASRGVRAAALALCAAVTLGGCEFSVYEMPLPGGADLGENPYTVTVYFDDVLDLVPQSAVKVDEVTVGKVEDISLRGYTARVTLSLHNNVRLPDNAVAQIRQTSLLGEKFVSLSAPPPSVATGTLGQGDTIPLARSGRNPEVEEVLGALSMLLNGGGVAQLKTINVELNNILQGREQGIRSLLGQLDTFMGQINANKDAIVQAIESLNRLAKSTRQQTSSIKAALDRMPRALDSLDHQRDNLIKMLDALGRLSDVGTRVIRASEENTVSSLRSLAPILSQLADAGQALPKSLQVFLTYPFVDAVVGTTPAEARNLHQGDYTNLSAKLDLDLQQMLQQPPGLPGGPGPNDPNPVEQAREGVDRILPGGGGGGTPQPDAPQLPGGTGGLQSPAPGTPSPTPTLSQQQSTPDGSGDGCLLVLCRTGPAYVDNTETDPADTARLGYDPDVAALLLQGVTGR